MRTPLTVLMAGALVGSLLVIAPQAMAEKPESNAAAQTTDVSATPAAATLPEFVIAGFGDSYGSGEGAPHTTGTYAYIAAKNKWLALAGKQPAVWTPNGSVEDRRCHRSPNSGLNQAAVLLEAAFRGKVNIVFRNFACSGGAIRSGIDAVSGELKTDSENGGILTRYDGMGSEKGWFDPPMLSQVEQANAWASSSTKSKQIDAAMVNVGGNDAGFGRMLFLCGVNWYLLGVVSQFLGGINECAEYKNGNLVASSDAQATIDLLSGPTSYLLTNDDLKGSKPGPAESKTRCTSLTMDDAAAGRCTPVLQASYALLAAAARGQTPTTYIQCTPAEATEANAQQGSASIGTSVRVSTGATCEKRLGGWAKVAFQYPQFTKAVSHVYLNTYPQGAITDSAGNLCNQTGTDPLTKEIRAAESELFQSVMVNTLNATILNAAKTLSTPTSGWTAVPVANTSGHGICATADKRWFNTNLEDGLMKMGEEKRAAPWWVPMLPLVGWLSQTESAVSSGWAHPNAAGFKNIYAHAIANEIRPQICAKFNLNPCPRIAGNPAGSLDGDVFGKVRSIDMNPVASIVTLTSEGTVIAETQSDPTSGNYSFSNVPVGTYEVTARPLAAWPPLAPVTLGVYVGANQQKELNLTLDFGAKITGQVKLPNGTPAAGVTVHAYLSPVNFPNEIPDEPSATAITDNAGTYTFPSLGAATLARLHIVPPPGTVAYKSVWYPDADRWQDADPISLEENDSITANPVVLEQGQDSGTIVGSVFTDGGFEAEGARVTAFSSTLGQVAQTRVEEDGTYILEDVPVGPVTVLFDTYPGHDWYSFQPRWYPGVKAQGQARVLDVVAGQTTELENVDLPFGAHISVHVDDQLTGEPVAGVSVTLVGDDGAVMGMTNRDGIALFEGLPTGSYKVGVSPDAPYLREWFEWSGFFDEASVIEAEAGYGNHVPIGLEKIPDDVDFTLTRETDKSVTINWRMSVGADYLQIQRRLEGQRRFVNVVTGHVGASYRDTSQVIRTAPAEVCYRMRAKAVTGAVGAWILDCLQPED